MSRYGIASPDDLEATWSWARVYVMGEAAFHNSYIPPSDGSGGGREYGAQTVEDMFALGILEFQEVA